LLTNPPYGVDWKKDKEAVEKEASRGFGGRFGAGTPRISDGQLLFLQHLVSKMKPIHDGGSRMAIILNGSPLFTGSAGSGESEIRRWLLEKDLVETIISLPDQLFYNTGISTYVWILSNRKNQERKNKVQLIDARNLFTKMRKSLGQKRKEISDEAREKIVEFYREFKESKKVKIPVQLGREPREKISHLTKIYYKKLLSIISDDVFIKGEWLLIEPQSAAKNNLSFERFFSWIWHYKNNFRLIVINYSDKTAQCRLHIPFTIPNEIIVLEDLLTGAEYIRSTTEIKSIGLFIELKAYQSHIFSFTL